MDEVKKILESCLADWSHAATMVCSIMTRIKKALDLLKRQPKIVRCIECKHGEICTQSWDDVMYVECHAHDEQGYDREQGHPLDWFCADGESKDGDNE